MIDSPRRPLLFLDVDGPLLPFGSPSERDFGIAAVRTRAANPLAGRIEPALGPLLLSLGCEMVWATTWGAQANISLTPVLGLPRLEVMDWPDESDDRIDMWFGLHWKTRALVARAADRAFVWVDDEIGDGDREWVAEHHDGRALLYRIDARVGLRHSDVAAISAWLAGLPRR